MSTTNFLTDVPDYIFQTGVYFCYDLTILLWCFATLNLDSELHATALEG